MYSRTVFVGRLTADLELRKTQTDRSFCQARLAVERSIKPKNAEKPDVDFHNIIFWGKTAELAAKYLAKGRLILVEGRLRNDVWKDKNGSLHREEVLDVTDLQFLERKKTDEAPAAPEMELEKPSVSETDSYDYEAMMSQYREAAERNDE